MRHRSSRGPSAYIPVSQLTGPYVGDNIAAVMGLHPDYLHVFWKTQHQLLRMDGALSLPERHYVAIMASARHQCTYLVSLHSSCFLQVGGDLRWLEGFDAAPLKLRKLNDLNKILAHRPWLITKEHIEGSSTLQEAERVLAEIKKLDEEGEETSQEEMETRFEREKRECAMVPTNGDNSKPVCFPGILRFLEDPDFGYIDFTRRGEQAPPTFRAHDYTWEDHGYSLLQRLNPEVGQLLDDKFQVAFNLTYHTCATHCGVDTFKLRRAIWNYIQCIYGIRYDDYDYGEVNQLLERSLKVYMKTVTCHPERVTRQLYNDFWRQFKHSEKVHLNFLLLEARLQAALLYSLRAITRYMT
ncbi:sestrin 2 L homeolog isoform X2 [Xenopus laevis]|uniref:Sestrin 2 L homeolog isoform X2 n=1 Tax=Xenopus laevis TaxID=8355 RepID=A0A8J0U3P7_XENLA|nr:sestrin 2 L homeolog isoform X2 [Xenopus laevis]